MIRSTAARNAASFVFDGLLKPLTFRTNCSEAARISASVTGGEKLKRILIFLHMSMLSMFWHDSPLLRSQLLALHGGFHRTAHDLIDVDRARWRAMGQRSEYE